MKLHLDDLDEMLFLHMPTSRYAARVHAFLAWFDAFVRRTGMAPR